MIARRHLLGLLGMVPFMGTPQRPDQAYDPPVSGLAPSSQSGFFLGRRVVVIGTGGTFSGVFIYSPTAGANNLVESHTAGAVTDPYGNNVRGGDVTYDSSGFACQKTANGITILKNAAAPAQSGAWNQVANVTFNEGAGANWWISPPALIAIAGAARTTTAALEIQGTGNAAMSGLVSTGTGLISETTTAGLSGGVPAVQVDNTQIDVTSAAIVTASNSWPIPAGDANHLNACYKLDNTGFFNVKNAANAPSWNVKVFGQTFFVFSTTGFPVTQLIYTLEAWVSVRATGATGTFSIYGRLSFSVPNTSTNQTWTFGSNTNTADLTAATVMEMDFGWGNITGGPDLLSSMSIFSKLG